jgi:NADP-dependent 3-hydroxy acid dehydrogenase YdfG
VKGAARIPVDGAVVAITGGGRGIGLATARSFAARGATVCIGDLDGESAVDACESLGPGAHPFQLDVRSLDSFTAFVEGCSMAAGQIDVLVNNAGVMPAGRFLDESEATTDTILQVNVAGPIHGMRLVLPGMIERGRGHVVNVASMLGKTQLPGLATYVASKHAVVGLTAGVRGEIHGTGVTLTTVLPGIVNTELASGIKMPGFVARVFRVEPEDIARAIVGSLEGRPREVAVPRWMGLYPAVIPFVPSVVEDFVRRVLGDDRALRGVDPAGRAAYESSVSRQATAEPGDD